MVLSLPAMLCRPYGAFIWGVYPRTGVDTPAYALAPYGLLHQHMVRHKKVEKLAIKTSFLFVFCSFICIFVCGKRMLTRESL